jgi:dolichyl-diphosphooligosaccharide--protein glycosyltransferase
MCFKELRDEHVFVIIYAVVGSYFAGVMVRLMLTLTPCVCVTAAIALTTLLEQYMDPVEPNEDPSSIGPDGAKSETSFSKPTATSTPAKKVKKAAASAQNTDIAAKLTSLAPSPSAKKGIFGLDTRFAVIANALLMLFAFVTHCTWVTSNAYSSPSVVLSSNNPDGSKHIIDDYREAYYWLRQNTPETSVIMSWWDYGYQIAGFGDRTTLVDNNTWNNSKSAERLIKRFFAHHRL